MRLRWRLALAAMLVLGLGGLAGAAFGLAAPTGATKYRAFLPAVTRAEPTPTPQPTPEPPPYGGAVQSLYLASARILGGDPIEYRDTRYLGSREVLEDPSGPRYVAMYPRFGTPGWRGGNTTFAAHVNYVGYGNGPFAYLTNATAGDALYVSMDNGLVYTYTVRSVDVVPLADLDMNAIVYPPLDSHTERVTLISCGGDFVPNPSGVGGEYESRVILIAERFIP